MSLHSDLGQPRHSASGESGAEVWLPKIHIAFGFVAGPYGGGNQFLKALRAELVLTGRYVEDLEEADVVVINSFHRGQEEIVSKVIEAKRRKPGLFVFHRVDGPYSLVRGRPDYADFALIELNKLIADGTIFQSEWSRTQCLTQGLDPHKSEVVISNAPATGVFAPAEKTPFRGRRVRLVATSWSTNPNKGFDTYSWMDENLDWNLYEMTIFGNSPSRFENIRIVQPLPTAELARELQQFDIFVSAARNEPCSNALIEALHSGLPAIVFRGGGSPGLLGRAGLTFDSAEQIPDCISQIIDNYEECRESIKAPSITQIAEQYLEFIDRVMLRSPPRILNNLHATGLSRRFLTELAKIRWAVWGRLPNSLKSKTWPIRPSLSRTTR